MTRRPLVGAIALALTLVALAFAPRAAAAAEPCKGPGPENAVALRPLAFFNHGVAGEYERFVAPRWLSLAIGPELRWGAHGDYSAFTGGLGTEARLWLMGRSFFGCLGERAMVGLYLGGRFDLAFTEVRDNLEDRSIGTTWTFMESILVGFRMTVWHFHVTPSAGLVLLSDVGGGPAPDTRPSGSLGLTLGLLF